MKKALKIIGIIIVVIVLIYVGVVAYDNISNKIKSEKRYNERINAKTLQEYIKTHSNYEYYRDDEDYNEYFINTYTTDEFKCDILDKKIKDIYNNYFILEDNSIYEFDLYELYSNNQNCKKIDMEIKSFVRDTYDTSKIYVITTDNKIYDFYNFENKYEYKSDSSFSKVKANIILKGDVKQILYVNGTYVGANYDDEKATYLVLKNDGIVYKQEYFNQKLTSEKVFLSDSEYGKISYIDGYYDSEKNIYNIERIISDKGYFYKGIEETEECQKYKDIECEKKIMQSAIYKRFSKDIKLIGDTYTLLTDNTILSTSELTRKLDKELKE